MKVSMQPTIAELFERAIQLGEWGQATCEHREVFFADSPKVEKLNVLSPA